MSHVVSIDLKITNLSALAQAAEMLGMELMRGQKTYRWWGKHVGDYPLPEGFSKEDLGQCDHAIRIKDNDRAFEVGLVRQRNGQPGYEMIYDFYGGGRGLMEVIGGSQSAKSPRRLVQAYAAATVAMTMGHTYNLTREELEDGSMRVTLSR